MKKRLGTLALECFLDLGITLVYAVLVGFLIVGIVATDETPVSILSVSLYAAALPGSALALIVVEVALRTFKEWREARNARPADPGLADSHLSLRTSVGPTASR